jgi:hypothetical protein
MRGGVLECGTVRLSACPRYVLQQGERTSPTLPRSRSCRLRGLTDNGLAWHVARHGYTASPVHVWHLSRYAVRCHVSVESANLHAAAAICCGAMDGMRCANDVSA